jgi:hypothetical protein
MSTRDRHQVAFAPGQYARLSEEADRLGVSVGSFVWRCYEEWRQHHDAEPLEDRANRSPLVTGDRMLAALLETGSVKAACERVRATQEEWDRVVPTIPMLREKIEMCFGRKHAAA